MCRRVKEMVVYEYMTQREQAEAYIATQKSVQLESYRKQFGAA